MWVVTIPQLAYFAIRRHRNRLVIKNLLGAWWKGILTTDRYSAYSYLPLAQRQLCWAHLLRDFLAMQQWGEAALQVGTALHREGKRRFRLWHRVRDGTMSRAEFAQKIQPVQQRVHERLKQGAMLSVKKVARTCRRLLKVEPALWTFVHTQGLEPTNNEAERTVRPGVLMRKVSLGTQSAQGSLFVERMLTVTQSLRRQGRNVLHFLTTACQAALSGSKPPSLLPPAPVLPSAALAA
jgi:transposase